MLKILKAIPPFTKSLRLQKVRNNEAWCQKPQVTLACKYQDYANELKAKVETHQLSSYIQFRDFVDNPIELMRCFEVVVLTTYQETFGLVLAEAMRAGVAVIGTNAGGVPDIIEHDQTGLLTEPGSPESLATAIQQLYKDPAKLSKLSTHGKIKADSCFSDDVHFTKLESILNELTG